LGHLRHEIGHYYWERLIKNSPLIDDFRERFGDDRQDYAQALTTGSRSPTCSTISTVAWDFPTATRSCSRLRLSRS